MRIASAWTEKLILPMKDFVFHKEKKMKTTTTTKKKKKKKKRMKKKKQLCVQKSKCDTLRFVFFHGYLEKIIGCFTCNMRFATTWSRIKLERRIL